MGLTGAEAAEKIVELLNLPITPEEYLDLAQKQYAQIMPEAQLMSGNNFCIFLFQILSISIEMLLPILQKNLEKNIHLKFKQKWLVLLKETHLG